MVIIDQLVTTFNDTEIVQEIIEKNLTNESKIKYWQYEYQV